MRREELYLRDIVEAADHIASFVAESGLSGFRESEMVRSAIVQKLGVIGEAAEGQSVNPQYLAYILDRSWADGT